MRVLRETGSITNKFETNVSQYGNGEAYSEVVNSKGYAKEAKEHRDAAEAAKLEALLAAEKAKESEVNAKASESLSEAFKDITEANVAITEENAQEATEQAIRSEVAANTSSEASIEASVYAATASSEANNSLLYANQAKGYKDQAEGFSIASEASSVASAVSAAEAGGYTEEVKELYEAFAKGAVYRGGWNPMITDAYPDPHGTNSYWDVYLNVGTSSYDWNGISWASGDRLIYSIPDNQYFHIKAAGGVSSVNGKRGAVLLNASDVGAVGTTGNHTINGLLTVKNNFLVQGITGANEVLIQNAQTATTNAATRKDYVDDLVTGLRSLINNLTAADVGAISSADNNNIDIRARFKGLVVGDANQASQVSYGDIWQFTSNSSPRTLIGSSSSRGQYAGFQWNNSAKTFTLQHSSAGDVITLDANGHATMLNDPTSAKHIATKAYVDANKSTIESVNGKIGTVVLTAGDVGAYTKAEVDSLAVKPFGSVGDSALMYYQGTTSVTPGVAVPGSDLRYSNTGGGIISTVPQGTWRCQGYIHTLPDYKVTLFTRIA